ncbi:hypothetical protein NNO_0206 [Hydrogenimonas sp.]|nr:hypothetical protein NNO_0206 [Hydrogenimonas sp.]
MEKMALEIHIASVIVLALIIAADIAAIFIQKDDWKLKKYLRIQATAWSTVLSMVIFTGMIMMTVMKTGFTVKVIVMIAASLALITLEVRRHLDLKRAKIDSECFEKFRKRALRYYIFELVWLLMVGGLSPRLS